MTLSTLHGSAVSEFTLVLASHYITYIGVNPGLAGRQVEISALILHYVIA